MQYLMTAFGQNQNSNETMSSDDTLAETNTSAR